MSEEDGRLMKKLKKAPMVPIGIAGLIGIVGYGLFSIKQRKERLSIYLIHFRLAAQGSLLACLTLGVLYSLVKNNLPKFLPEKKN